MGSGFAVDPGPLERKRKGRGKDAGKRSRGNSWSTLFTVAHETDRSGTAQILTSLRCENKARQTQRMVPTIKTIL